MQLDAGRYKVSHTAFLVAGMVISVGFVKEDKTVVTVVEMVSVVWYAKTNCTSSVAMLALVPKFRRNSLKAELDR